MPAGETKGEEDVSDDYDQSVCRRLKSKRGKWTAEYHFTGRLSIRKGEIVVLHLIPSQRSMVCVEEVVRLLEESRKGKA